MLGGLLAWISQHDAQAIVVGLGVVAAAITAVIVLFRQPVIARPLRWVGRKAGLVGKVLIGDPLSRSLRHALDGWAEERIDPRIDRIESKVDEVRMQVGYNNGGSSLKDGQDAIAVAVGLPARPKVYPPPPDSE